MKIYKITKRNFARNKTGDVKPHKNKLRFHISINAKFYEYAIGKINKRTINIQCAAFKCHAWTTLIPGDHLKRTKKECNSKKSKFEWADTNNETDYFDIKSYTIKDHSCTEMCLKGCVLKHTCRILNIPAGSRHVPCDKGEKSTLASKDFDKAGESIAKKGLFF